MVFDSPRRKDGPLSRFAIVRALLGAVAAMLRLFLRNVHRTLYGSCTTLAFIAIILVTFLAAPQAEELALARVKSPLALIRMLVALIWFSATIWHCSDAKLRSRPILLAGRLAAFRRSAIPALLAVGFAGVMAVSEVRAVQVAAALPRSNSSVSDPRDAILGRPDLSSGSSLRRSARSPPSRVRRPCARPDLAKPIGVRRCQRRPVRMGFRHAGRPQSIDRSTNSILSAKNARASLD